MNDEIDTYGGGITSARWRARQLYYSIPVCLAHLWLHGRGGAVYRKPRRFWSGFFASSPAAGAGTPLAEAYLKDGDTGE